MQNIFLRNKHVTHISDKDIFMYVFKETIMWTILESILEDSAIQTDDDIYNLFDRW